MQTMQDFQQSFFSTPSLPAPRARSPMATTTATPLALDFASHALREDEALLDALPYVDLLDPAEAAAAEAAIADEVRKKEGGGSACLASD